MTILLVQDTVTFLNMYPSKNGISSDLRPAAIILGSPNPDYKKLSIAFVAYEKVCIGTTNSTKYRTVGEIRKEWKILHVTRYWKTPLCIHILNPPLVGCHFGTPPTLQVS